MNYSVIIFDCDGVILDSNKLKSEAMEEAVGDYDRDLVSQFIRYHKEHGGISRYEKFDYFLRKMAKNYSEKEYKRLLDRLSDFVRAKLIEVPLTNGAFEFMHDAHQSTDLYIVSGADQNELREVFSKRDLAKFFRGIYGSPTTKVDNCKKIKSNLRVSDSVLMIGDSRQDYIAANSCGFDFVFISGYTDMEHWQEFCNENSLQHFPDLYALSRSAVQ